MKVYCINQDFIYVSTFLFFLIKKLNKVKALLVLLSGNLIVAFCALLFYLNFHNFGDFFKLFLIVNLSFCILPVMYWVQFYKINKSKYAVFENGYIDFCGERIFTSNISSLRISGTTILSFSLRGQVKEIDFVVNGKNEIDMLVSLLESCDFPITYTSTFS